MKICYLLPRLLPTPSGAVVGGSAANCVSLALELKRQGVDIELLASVAPGGEDRVADGPLAEMLRPLAGGGRGLIGKGLGALYSLHRGLKTRFRESRVDVVHAHSGTYPYAIVPLAADHRTCVRLHSLYCPLGAKGGVYSNWWERPQVVRPVLERLDRIIAATANVRDSLHSAGVRPEKIELIPMCVDTRRFCPRAPQESGRYFPAESRAARILFVGNASKEKGLLELLHAIKLLNEQGVSTSLVAAIENQCGIKEYAARHDLARTFVQQAGIDRQVRFIGLVDAIEDLYAQADLLVIPWNTSRGPSDYPMVVLEAMAMGKCVVATPVGGCPELLDHGAAGILAEGFSPASLASAIRSVLGNPQGRLAIEQAAVRRAEELSLSVSAKRMISLYEHLLSVKERHD